MYGLRTIGLRVVGHSFK